MTERASKRKKEPPDKEPIKRPDVAARKQRRKTLVTAVVKTSLPGQMRTDTWAVGQLDLVRALLDEWMLAISQMTYRGSLVLNEVLQVCFREGQDLPKLDQTFIRRCITGDRKDVLVRRVLDSTLGDFPAPEAPARSWPVVSCAALEYLTNFKNSLCTNFEGIQRKFVKDWLRHHGYSQSPWLRVVTKYLQEETPTLHLPLVLPRDIRQFVQENRDHLPLLRDGRVPYPDNMKTADILQYFYYILSYRSTRGWGGGFTLAPVYSIRRRHIRLDTTCLVFFLRACADAIKKSGVGEVPMWLRDTLTAYEVAPSEVTCQGAQDLWKKFLHLRKLKAAPWEFDRFVTTDGVAISLTFARTKLTFDCEPMERLEAPTTNLKPGDRVVCIDPGRVNLVTAWDSYLGKYSTLSRKGYAQCYKGTQVKIARLENRLAHVTSEMSRFTLKTSDPLLAQSYRRVVQEHYHLLWKERSAKCRNRMAFHVHSRKQSVLASFFASLQGDPYFPPITVVYGAAPVRPGGKGEVSVPVSKVLHACRSQYRTVLANEHLTTKVHSNCGDRMHPVKNRSARYPIRGLCWCQTCRVFCNRDRNACANMYRVAHGESRPSSLAFDRPYEHRGVLSLLPSPLPKEGMRIQGG